MHLFCIIMIRAHKSFNCFAVIEFLENGMMRCLDAVGHGKYLPQNRCNDDIIIEKDITSILTIWLV